jgi:hypothetical protein
MDVAGLTLGVIPVALELGHVVSKVRGAYKDLKGGFNKQSSAFYDECDRMLANVQTAACPAYGTPLAKDYEAIIE